MNNIYKKVTFNNWAIKVCIAWFVIFSLWWIVLHLLNASSGQILIWADLYNFIALFGVIVGLVIARKWGGFKSTLGRATIMFSFGLLCEWFAGTAGAYLVWKVGTVPYPSLSDIGAFGALIFYAIAVIFLAKASGARLSLRSYKGKLIAIIVPAILLSASFAI